MISPHWSHLIHRPSRWARLSCAGSLGAGTLWYQAMRAFSHARPRGFTPGTRCENAWTPGEDTPGADMYQLYGAADRTSPPAPVIAQAVTPTAASGARSAARTLGPPCENRKRGPSKAL